MSYLPVRFPIRFATRPVGGPGFSTRIATVASGFEQRNQNWSASKWSGDASIGVKSDTDFKLVGSHFRMARGMTHHFRVKDYADFKVLRTEGVLVLITTTTFQIHKQYGAEIGFEELRKITRPVSGTLSVWKDATLQTVTTHYTINYETGIVTFLSAPGASVLEVAVEFDIPVRYDIDKLQATLIMPEAGDRPAYHSWEQIPLMEVRE